MADRWNELILKKGSSRKWVFGGTLSLKNRNLSPNFPRNVRQSTLFERGFQVADLWVCGAFGLLVLKAPNSLDLWWLREFVVLAFLSFVVKLRRER